MSEENQEIRKLAAIMFTDMVGYGAMTQKNETRAIELLEEHRGLLRPLFPKYGGREIETVGDAFFVEFSSAVEAVRCAVEMQHTLHERNQGRATDEHIRIRIGIHLGDVIQKGNHVLGDGVNIAARLEPLAPPEGICISEDVARQVQNKLDIPLNKLGQKNLKNIQFPMEIYSVQLPWGPPPAEGTAASLKQERVIETGANLSKKIISSPLLAAAVGALVLAAAVYFLSLKKQSEKTETSQQQQPAVQQESNLPHQSLDTLPLKPVGKEIKGEKKPIVAAANKTEIVLSPRVESATDVSKKEVEKKSVPPMVTVYYNPDSVLQSAREKYRAGDLKEARPAFGEALQQYRATRSKKGEADALLGAAKTLKQQDELATARGKAEEALALYNSVDDGDGVAKARLLVADILIEEGKPKDAENILGQIISGAASKTTGDGARAMMAKAHLALDNPEDAVKQMRSFESGYQRSGDAETDVLVAIMTARVRRLTGEAGKFGGNRQRRQMVDDELKNVADKASELEGRLAIGELGMKYAPRPDQFRMKLETLEREARAKGFALIARKANAILQ